MDKAMSKPRPKKLYAVVSEKRPSITYMELYQDTDVKLEKGEAMWEVEVKAIKCVKVKPEAPRRRTGHTHRHRGTTKARKTRKGASPPTERR